MKSALLFLASAISLSLVEATASPELANGGLVAPAVLHRRHHKKRGSGKCKTRSSSSSNPKVSVSLGSDGVSAGVSAGNVSVGAGVSWSSSSSAASSQPTGSSSSGSGSSSYNLNGFVKNNIYVGFLPDDGSGKGGQRETIQQIDSKMGGKSAAQGYYAQAQSGTLFDGSQLMYRWDEIINHGGVFQPAVMPTGGWWGLTDSDNRQAVAICQVMKKFTDAGLDVWLRFAHEVNWYQQDGTYQGTVDDFQKGWSAVAKACQQIAPSVKMFFTPNVASMAEYDKYFPYDPSTVDLIGIDYYPSGPGSFVSTMKPFHDKYCNDRIKFVIGEIGLNNAADINTRVQWLKEMTSAATAAAMPHYFQTSWFNYFKDYQFKIANTNGDSLTASYLA